METNDFSIGQPVRSAEEMSELVEQSAVLPTVQEEAEAAFLREMMSRRLSLAVPYPPEECLLAVDGVPFFAKGDLSAIKAKQKQGKTTAISIMVAAILCGQWGRLKAMKERAKVIFIDTEQKPQDSQLVYRRTLQLAGLPEVDDYDRLQVFTLRTLDTQQMLQGIRLIIRQEQPDAVFIDGIVDFIHNFNEVEESQQVIKDLSVMATADFSGRDIAIVAVLHENKSMDDRNMRGHLGTMLSQKAGIVLQCVKLDDVFTVKCSDARHAPVPDWSFQYDREGNVVDADRVRMERMEAEREIRRQMAEKRIQDMKDEKLEVLTSIIKREGGRILRTKLREEYMTQMNVKRCTANRIIRLFMDKEFYADGDFISLEMRQTPTLGI